MHNHIGDAFSYAEISTQTKPLYLNIQISHIHFKGLGLID